MGFEDVVNLVVSNGIGVACIIYFMFRDYKFTTQLTQTLSNLNTLLMEFREERERS